MKAAASHIAVVLVYILLVCVLLFPLPLNLSDGFFATEPGDPLLQIWVLRWNIHKLSTSLSSYFDANIFYPYQNTFAYHDHMFGLGLLGLPIYALSHNPILTYNLLFLLSFVLSAYGMFLLVRELTSHSGAAWIAGFIFGFLPYRFTHLDHLNLLSIYWLPFCFLFVTRYFFSESRSTCKISTTIALWYLCFLLQALTSFNYLFFSVIAIGVYASLLLLLRWNARAMLWRNVVRRDFTLFLIGALLTGFVLLLFARPYLKANREMGFERSVTETIDLSARLRHYGVAPENNLLYGKVTRAWQSSSTYFREQILFPGIIPVMLALSAIIVRRSTLKNPSIEVFTIAYMGVLLAAFILSLGPFLTIAGRMIPLPYSWLYQFLPGFKSMRVPARFGLLVAFAMAVLAGIGFSRIDWLFKVRKARIRSFLTFLVISGMILLEYWSLPRSLSHYPGNFDLIPAAYQWLAKQPDDVRLIELPVSSPKDNFEAMYYSTFHWKRIINGRSAFLPNGISGVLNEMRHFPSQRTVDLLQQLGINSVLWHTQDVGEDIIEKLPEGANLMKQFGTDLLITLDPRPIPESLSPMAPIFDADYQIPRSLQASEDYTIGIDVNSLVQFPYSPLPEERALFQVEWIQNTATVFSEFVTITLPVFFQIGESKSVPFRLTTPSSPGEYQLHIHPKDSRFNADSVNRHITLLPEIIDSRRPEKLQAEFLRIDIPDVWKAGTILPVRVLVKNSGNTLWKSRISDRKHPIGEVRLGIIEWQNTATGERLIQQRGLSLGARGLLTYDLAPGQETWITLDIPTPYEVGEFLIELDMVSEGIQWFSAPGSPSVAKTIQLQ